MRGLLLANILGPYLFGIYGFISMMLWYLLSTGLGVNYAINVELSTQDEISKEKLSEKINTALVMTAVIGFTIILIGTIFQIFKFHIFDKYIFYKYTLIIGCITCTNLIQQVLINVYRYYRKLFRIALVELLSATFLLLIALSFRGFELINAILLGLLVSGLISITILLINAPFGISLRLNFREANTIIKVGIPLLIYNVSFLMMTIIGQTIISIYFSVETMGYYTLANNIAGAILLGIHSIAWIIFPDVLFKTRESVNNSEVMRISEKITEVFSIIVYITVYISIIMLPLLYLFLPKYKPTHKVIVILLLSQAVLSHCFGYLCLALARKKQLLIAKKSISAVLIVAILSILVVIIKLDYIWIAVTVLFASYIFNILVIKSGIKIISDHIHYLPNRINNISFSNILVLIICFFGSILGYPSIGAVLSFMLFFYLNKDKVIRTYVFCVEKIQSGNMR
jgi:O-antigen/teichoic acid export membrane protein